MMQKDPLFFARIGGVEWNIVMQYFLNKQNAINNYDQHVQYLGRSCGYFDFTQYRVDYFIAFCENMIRYYKDAQAMTYGNVDTINQFYEPRFRYPDKQFYEYICEDKTMIIYTFIEALTGFLNTFKIWGEGKKVLIISPFAKSITSQWQKKDELIKNYTFPNIELKTYNTKITYCHPYDSKDTLRVTTNHFQEEVDLIKNDIKDIDFDIAFLSCAAYSMPLGDYISKDLQKKAVYIGGILNMMFAIYGGRYKQMYKYIVNMNNLISPVENADIEHITAGRFSDNEAIHAYFGNKGDAHV